jgi:hypothetical protein
MSPNIKDDVAAADQIMIDDPIDNPEWWKEKVVHPGSRMAHDKREAAEQAGVPSAVAAWATVDPSQLGETEQPYAVSNLVNGRWTSAVATRMNIPNPMNKNKPDLFSIPDTHANELGPFYESLRAVPKTGLHNPLKNNHRYVQYGEISRKVNYISMIRFIPY